jgi:hypothetical protein
MIRLPHGVNMPLRRSLVDSLPDLIGLLTQCVGDCVEKILKAVTEQTPDQYDEGRHQTDDQGILDRCHPRIITPQRVQKMLHMIFSFRVLNLKLHACCSFFRAGPINPGRAACLPSLGVSENLLIRLCKFIYLSQSPAGCLYKIAKKFD